MIPTRTELGAIVMYLAAIAIVMAAVLGILNLWAVPELERIIAEVEGVLP